MSVIIQKMRDDTPSTSAAEGLCRSDVAKVYNGDVPMSPYITPRLAYASSSVPHGVCSIHQNQATDTTISGWIVDIH